MQLIPPHAPFSPEHAAALNAELARLSAEQSFWLSAFLAGRASSAGAGSSTASATPPVAAPAAPVTVLYGTESGNSETLAAEAQKRLKKEGFKVSLQDMASFTPEEAARVENLLVIVSTWGEGDPPERATDFYEAFMADSAPKFSKTRFAVCGLGDTSYEHFCKMGKDFDTRLEALGATRLTNRMDCDVDFDEPFAQWFDATLAALKQAGNAAQSAATDAPEAASAPMLATAIEWNKTTPFPAELTERILLNGTGSNKETMHVEFSLAGSGIQYLPGDALGVKPSNCPEVIDDFINILGLKGDENVERRDGGAAKLRALLIEELDSTVLSKKLIDAYAPLAKSGKLDTLLQSSRELKAYIEGREIADMFNDFPAPDLQPQQLVELLRTLPPRLYSIASSLKAHPEEVHLTVGVVRYQAHGKQRKGVASTYLADRLAIGDKAPVYIHHNNNFRLPENADTPIIMVGPGTGIAPFRAFIEERAALNAPGKNWLFFGDQHYTYDFLYQLEWQDYLKDGILTKLDVAFSRDAPEKYYVQDAMRKNARELWQWLEKGAHFYVCGDATRMAKDVHQTLIDIAAEQGKMNESDAKKYITQLGKEKRYQKDVY